MKKIFYRGFILGMLMSVSITNLQAQTSTNEVWTEKEAAKWFKKGEWLNGLTIKPHKSVDKLELAKQYHKNKERWDRAFAYLKNTDLIDLKPGTYPIDGENVFAIVAEANKKDFAQTKWESHRNYQDIQFVIKGKEKIGVTPMSDLAIMTPYETARDVTFYSGDGGNFYTADPKTFFIFFPQDGHRPDIKVKGFETDKKIVIKVKFD